MYNKKGMVEMTKKAAVLIADGCEEVEALSPVDVLRRLGLEVDMVGLNSKKVIGDHDIVLTCDKILDVDLLEYDIVIFPGGYPGAENLKNSTVLKGLMQRRAQAGKWNAAMCAAPLAFAAYGLLDGSEYTCYPSVHDQIKDQITDGHFKEDIVVIDHDKRILTSRGPATSWAYSYAIAEILGADTTQLKEAMLYNFLSENITR